MYLHTCICILYICSPVHPLIVSADGYFQPPPECKPIEIKSTRGADLGRNSSKGVKPGS